MNDAYRDYIKRARDAGLTVITRDEWTAANTMCVHHVPTIEAIDEARLLELWPWTALAADSRHRKFMPRIKDVIFHDPATIIKWADGSKTIVKCSEGDVYDPEKGLAMAICKKMLGNEGNYYNEFKKWLPKEKEK